MSIQILKLRDGSKGKYEAGFEEGLRALSVEDIFKNPQKHISNLYQSEHFNLYYTIAECLEEKGRKLQAQHHIPFDVDKLDIPFTPEGDVDRIRLTQIADIVCKAIGVPFDACGVLFSGNGLQIIVGTTHTITSTEYFDEVRRHYKAVCDRINLRLIQTGVTGEADPSVWSPARLMRYPETINRKPNKPERTGILLNNNIVRVDFDLKKASGLPDVQAKDSISRAAMDAFPTPDTKTIMAECKFLHWAQTHPEKVSEPEWYAAVSITARFEDGNKFTHKMSEGHPKYSHEETDTKIQQALDSSGARTCKNIEAISGGKCRGCKHHNTKLISPILIAGPDHIKTAKSGFHNVFVHEDGKIKIGKPNFEDLRRQFNKDYDYVAVATARDVWSFNGKTFQVVIKDDIEAYALNHFNPRPANTVREEFFAQVRLHNMVKSSWFSESVEGKMNFQNGILDVKSGVLAPHSKSYGFRSVLACEYAPDAKAPRFEQFMNEVTCDRKELADCIQEYLGYVFANGKCDQQKALLLLGDGSNGKSTLMKVVRQLAGDQGVSSLSLKDMNKEESRYRMEGKLLNIGEENSRDSFRETDAFKKIVGGDTISAKKLWSDAYEYENKTKLIILCNELPASTDLTDGFFRRMIIIPFDQIFNEEKDNLDRDIDVKLAAELPGIANWIMEGYRRLMKQRKITVPKKSKQMLIDYRKEVDLISDFFDEYCEVVHDDSIWTNKQELYDSLRRHCQDMGSKYEPSQKKLFAAIKRRMEHMGINYEEKDTRVSDPVSGKRVRALKCFKFTGETLA